MASWVGDFDMKKKPPPPGAADDTAVALTRRDRPWRKPAAAVSAEREAAKRALGGGGGGVDVAALQYVLRMQEKLDTEPPPEQRQQRQREAAQLAATALLQAATNARGAEEVAAARRALEEAVEAAGLVPATAPAGAAGARRALTGLPKLQLLHQALPRLWVGGWAALNNNCEALRSRRITHVVSVVSADQRRLPSFVQGHYYARVDDRDEAAREIATHFEPVARFIDAAREAGGAVFVHCGAGISRAPTVTTAYVMWKLGIGAADAVRIVKSARACVRPNPGFAAQLKLWQGRLDAGAVAGAAPRQRRDAAKAEGGGAAVGAGAGGVVGQKQEAGRERERLGETPVANTNTA